jgi:hypothetical protein
MAVSGSKNYSITTATIREAALRKLGVYDQGEAPSGDDVSAADFALNLMVKEWVAEGVDIFLRTESTLFLQPNTQSYLLSTANITDSYTETVLSSALASGSSTIVVDDKTGWTNGDFIGLKQDDNTIHWTTISDATTPNITDVTTDTCAAGNKVYTYTTKADRPQKLLYAFRSDINGFDTEIAIIGSSEYFRQSNKTSDGPPVEVWYNPQGNQSVGKLHVWPDNGGKTWDKIVMIAQHYPDDFDASANNADFPIEYGNALVWGLAAELASEYGLPEQEQARLWAISRSKLQTQIDYDEEGANVVFAMDLRG